MINILKKLFSKNPIEIFCPNCQSKLEKKPGRKTKCKFCEKYIYVRTEPSTGNRILVNDTQKEKIDLEWEQISYKKRWLVRLSDITEKYFDTHKAEMIKRSKQKVKNQDVVWSILGKLLDEAANKLDFQAMSRINYTQALFYNEEGRDPFKLLQSSSRNALLNCKEINRGIGRELIKEVSILSGDKSCNICKENNGIKYTLEQALEKNPLPCRECSFILEEGKYPFCRCLYR